ncbi:MAG: hypothetical protein WCC74_00490 [Minisyncoccia bacterium]
MIHPKTFADLIYDVILSGILEPLIVLLSSLTILIFVWGILKYMRADSKEREEGKKYMFWGVIGIFVMFSLWGLVNILQNSFGLDTTSSIIPPVIDLQNL